MSKLSLFPLIFSLLFQGCVGDRSGTSPAEGESWHLEPQPEVMIGALDGRPEYLFGAISSIQLMPDGRLVVGDRQNNSVRLFDPEGRFLRDLGRSGDGPGEFRDIAGVWPTAPDRIRVLDLRLRRITEFTLEGDVVAETQLEPQPRTHADHYVGTFSDGSIVVGTGGGFVDTQDSNLFASELNYWRFGADGRYHTHIRGLLDRWWYSPTARGGASGVPGPTSPGGAAIGGTHALSPRPRPVVHGDSMYFPEQAEPTVKVLSMSGATVRSIPLPPSGLTYEEALASVRRALLAKGDERGLARLDVMPRPSRLPQVFGLLVDPEGLLWTARYDPERSHSRSIGFMRGRGQGGEWWVVDRSGAVRATVTMPDDFLPLQVHDSLIAGISVGDFNVERVAVYRLKRDP